MSGPKRRGRRRFPFAALAFVLLLLGVTAGLRLVGLSWELPNRYHYFSYHPDEVFLLIPSFQYFAQGDWNPHFFNYGTLYIYLVGIPAVLSGIATNMPNLGRLYWLGRLITALLGVGTVALLYFAVCHEGRRLAVASAALLAVLPLHVINSHYATVDVPATFWLVLAFLFALRGAGKPGWPLAILTGLAVGLAAATKYNVGLFLIPALLAPLVPPARAGLRRWAPGVVLGAIAGFLIGVPYAFGPEFPAGFLFELRHAREGGTIAFVGTGPGWIYHLVHGFPIALGFPLLAALALGIVVTVRTTSRAARLSLLWCALYLLMIGFSRERFIRYLVPMAPFLAVIAAQGLVWLWRRPRGRPLRAATAGVGAAVVVLTLLYSGGLVAALRHDDPRERAWGRTGPTVVSFNPQGKVQVGLVQAPWFFSPPVSPWNAGPLTRETFAQWDAEHDERIVVTGWDTGRLEAMRPWAFFLSDLESRDLLRLRDPQAVEFVRALDRIYAYHTVIANPRPRFSWLAPGREWAPPDWLYPWPQITLYTNFRPLPDEPRF
jgi:4-amino-4-deoxy-L-arabinose transferase-like glycosyltransferase